MSAIAMQTKFGPLLTLAIDDLGQAATAEESMVIAAAWTEEAAPEQSKLPVVIKMPSIAPHPSEGWRSYRARVEEALLPLRDKVAATIDAEPQPLIAGNALKADADPDQLRVLAEYGEVAKLELDPLVQVVSMDDSVVDIEVGSFATRHHPHGTGAGVTVAVLDSGVDARHPFLQVAKSIETCGESVEIPGRHGTHCAGSIASRDTVYPGVAPGVTLLNIKVLMADGRGRHTDITRGIDRALDEGAHVLSMSLGFNHLPKNSDRGHGWMCTKGHCPLCTAVDNAVISDGAVVVVAAGNEHERAVNLRNAGRAAELDTELGCPGQAREAITVAATTKRTFLLAPFSSHGPSSYGTDKPDLCAPGVNITSTVPVPRKANGKPVSKPKRALLFDRDSGTSMATPMVAGAAALIIQRFQQNGIAWTPAMVRNELVTRGVAGLPLPKHQIGAGRLFLQQI